MELGQVLTAMVTPFDHNEDIDFTMTTRLVHYLIANGSDALVISGTTGESPTLAMEEKAQLFRHVVQVTDGRIPVVAGTGCNNTRESVHLTQIAEEAGVDGIMAVTPYYNKPSQEGLYQHFKAIAAHTILPVMLYNIPGRSAVNLSPETIIRLSQIDNITSVKEASGDLNAMSHIIRETDQDFSLYSGDDSLTLPVLSIGGQGVVSVASHIIGNDLQAMVRSFKEGDHEYAATLHHQLLPIMQALFTAPSPSPVKAALELMGVPVGSVRLPLVPLTHEEMQALETVIQSLTTEAAS